MPSPRKPTTFELKRDLDKVAEELNETLASCGCNPDNSAQYVAYRFGIVHGNLYSLEEQVTELRSSFEAYVHRLKEGKKNDDRQQKLPMV